MKKTACLSVMFAIGCAMVTLCGPVSFIEVNGNADRHDSVDIVIRNGQLSLFANAQQEESDGINLNREVPIFADRSIDMTFTSQDFIYTVEQDELEMSVVVLPNSTARRTVVIPTGEWKIGLVQGCGRLFAGHEKPILLKAEK